MFLLSLQDFITQYFTGPIENPAVYGNYNVVSTLVYAAILLAASFLVIYPFFSRKGVKFDYRFALAVLPYVVLGSSLRILEDLQWAGMLGVEFFNRSANPLSAGYYFVSPGIYIFIGLFAVISLFACLRLFRENHAKPFGIIGAVAAVPFLLFALVSMQNPFGFALVLAGFAVVFAAVVFAFRALGRKLLDDRLNRLAFAGQLLDGTATFVATTYYNFSEQHVVSNAVLGLSPLLFPAVKIALVLAIIYYIDKSIENPGLKGFAKIFVMIIGFAPGIRDLLSLGALGTTFGGFI